MEEKDNKKTSLLIKAKKSVSNIANNISNFTKAEIEKIKNDINFKKAFEAATYEFKVQGTDFSFRGIKKINEFIIYVRLEDEKVIKYVKSGSILNRTNDSYKLTVISVESKQVVNFNIMVNELEIPIALFSITVKNYESEKVSTVINQVTQTMHITGSTVGNINQVNDIANKLNEFELVLNSYKPNIINRKTHAEAVKIYGDVKESIINGRKDSPEINKFKDLLGKLGIALLSAFITIIK